MFGGDDGDDTMDDAIVFGEILLDGKQVIFPHLEPFYMMLFSVYSCSESSEQIR